MARWSCIVTSSVARSVNTAGTIRNLLDVIRTASKAILGGVNIVPGCEGDIWGNFTGTWTGISFGDEGYELI